VPARGPTHLYVYYRVRRDTAAARRAVAALFAEVEAATGVGGRLLARSDDPRTWLEVYAPVTRPVAFLRTLAVAVRRHGVAALAVDGTRHVERFAALAPKRRG
jgi:hypothetical protein